MSSQLPLWPLHSNWTAPKTPPDLSYEKILAIDTETFDPNLITHGPGYRFNNGNICGISIATINRDFYFPINHVGIGNCQFDVFSWIREIFRGRNLQKVIFANAQYDLGWLHYHNITFNNKCSFIDVLITEALLNEEHQFKYSLDNVSKIHLGEGKDETLLNKAFNNFGLRGKQDISLLEAKYVGPYGEADARRTFDTYIKQKDHIANENLHLVWDLEMSLIPLIFKMHQQGVRVDESYGSKLLDDWGKKQNLLCHNNQIDSEKIWSTDYLSAVLKKCGIKTPKTAKGNNSVTNDFLEFCNHPIAKIIWKIREYDRCSTYLREKILNSIYHERVYPQFIQITRGDEGTKTGRFSSRHPNFQQFPVRSRIISSYNIRKCFLPEEGEKWAKADYSSQEPRIQLHYALIKKYPGAKEAKKAFEEGKKLYDLISPELPQLDYRQCKDVLLGISYGLQKKGMSHNLNIDISEADEILNVIHERLAFINLLANAASNTANNKGYVRTILGRKRRFDWWCYRNDSGKITGAIKGEKAARDKFPHKLVFRAFTHKAFNAIVQGTAADQTKQAMLNLFKVGAYIIAPVHDEINCSISSGDDGSLIKETMENAIPMKIPFKVDLTIGPTWK